MAVVEPITFQDALESLRDYSGGATVVVETTRIGRRAIHAAYSQLVTMRRWRYYYRPYRLNVNAAYSTGTVEYDYTGHATCERALVLTTGTWPTWAASGSVRIDNVVYGVIKRYSNSVVQLDVNRGPIADIASGTSYSLSQGVYTLPEDFAALDRPMQEDSDFWSHYVSPSEWLQTERYNSASSGSLSAWTIMADTRTTGRKALYMFPYPSTAQTLDFIYQKIARPLRYSGFLTGETSSKSGTVSGTAANTTIRGTSTVFSNAMAGSVIRLINGTGAPEGLGGVTPYLEQLIIDGATGVSTLTTKTALVNTYAAGKGYTISDPIDIPPTLHNAFLALCELHYDRLSGAEPGIQQQTEARFQREFVLACGAEQDNLGPRSAWDNQLPRNRRLSKMPLGPDT